MALPSSPPALPSSPPVSASQASREQTASGQIVYLHDQESLAFRRGQIVHFGRKLKTMQKTLSPENQAKNAVFVVLPKSAKHASRTHCTVSVGQESVVIHALGQNGVLIDDETLSEGDERNIPISELEKQGFLLGFYSEVEVRLHLGCATSPQHLVDESSSLLEADPTSEATQLLDLPSSPVWSRTASSPGVKRTAKRLKLDSDTSSVVGKQFRAASSDAEAALVPSSDPYAHQEDNGYPPESSDESEDADEDEAARAAQLGKDGGRIFQH